MIRPTLGRYMAMHFFRWTFYIYLLFFVLIFSIDLVELTRAASKHEGITFGAVVSLSFLRVPEFAGRVLPFAVLFGAASSLLILNRRLELVVARASGVSVWQFLMPFVLMGTAIGLFSAMVYGPISLAAKRQSQTIEAESFGKVKGNLSNKTRNFWLRVGQEGGDVVIRARVGEDHGRKLTGVSAYLFGPKGEAEERIDAETAIFVNGANGKNYYQMTEATITNPQTVGQKAEIVDLPVNITESELLLNTSSPESVSFWSLPGQADRVRAAGRNYLPFLSRFQSQLSTPLLFVAMVLLAGCISLRFARFGQSGRVILGGIIAGFMLYVASELVITFGSNGFVPPAMAAWSPAFVATLIGITVLLHQEDG